MLINFRNALITGKRTPTAKDYVQSGLVAMWDGIENAGWGTHDPNATTWKDLTGNGHDAAFSKGHQGSGLNPDGKWSDNACVFPSTGVSTAAFVANLGNTLTLQFCISNRVSASRFWAVYDTYDDTVNFYYQGGDWGTSVYDVRVKVISSGSASWMPNAGTVSHYFGGGVVGLQKNNESPMETAIGSYSATSKQWCIGGPYGTNFFTGNMHNVRIYNRILTSAEIATNYAIDKERFNLP